jgi:hypothetical protein
MPDAAPVIDPTLGKAIRSKIVCASCSVTRRQQQVEQGV